MPGTLLIGYDVEFGSDDLPPDLGPPDATAIFLRAAERLHREMDAPATLFVVGQTLEQNAEAFRRAAELGLFDFQQHTYSHRGLKAFWQIRDGEHVPTDVSPGMSLEEIKQEVSKTNALLKDILGVTCLGLTHPAGCHLGLCDRPDILAVLHDEGIRFVRSWGRDGRGRFYLAPGACQEKIQPFWYPGDFGDILEFPIHGNDYNVRKEMGWDDDAGYRDWTRQQIDDAAERDLVWSYAIHDHSSIRNDPDLSLIRELIQHARDRGVAIRSYRQEYARRKRERSP